MEAALRPNARDRGDRTIVPSPKDVARSLSDSLAGQFASAMRSVGGNIAPDPGTNVKAAGAAAN
jgi:hypothetical protein